MMDNQSQCLEKAVPITLMDSSFTVSPHIPSSVQIPQNRKNREKKSLPLKGLLFWSWLVALLAVSTIAVSYTTASRQFFGIAGSHEKSISFQYPVEVTRIPVIEGEKVYKGETLIEVRRFDLAAELAVINEKISEVVAQKQEEKASTIAEIKSLESQKRSAESALDIQISKIETQLMLNTEWKNRYRDNQPAAASKSPVPSAKNVLVEKLDGLKNQRLYSSKAFQVTIDNLAQQVANSERPNDAKLAVLENRRQELQRQAETLKVKADFSGRIGSVLFTRGEQIEKFSPILTLHSEAPSYVKAYIHEGVLNEVNLGQKVWVQSTSTQSGDIVAVGQVTSLGNRIVEYPLRLKRNSFVSAWGREVIIALDGHEDLLLGEKVVVSLDRPQSWITTLSTWGRDSLLSSTDRSVPVTLDVADVITLVSSTSINTKSLESSGVVWDQKLKHYWLVSDESNHLIRFKPKDKTYEEISIPGLEISDAESISISQDKMYILASLSPSRSGKLKKTRRKFIELRRDGETWSVTREADLFTAIKSTLGMSGQINEAAVKLQAAINENQLDIESHQVIGQTVYLGLKSPISAEGVSSIWQLSNLDDLFSGNAIFLSLYATLRLTTEDNQISYQMSDMLFYGKHILITGVSQNPNNLTSNGLNQSGLWLFTPGEDLAKHLATFTQLKAEGIALSPTANELFLVFDGGNHGTSHFTQFQLTEY